MTQHQTSRTLVKSAPELWAECSDAASLARHLGAFGEIRITKLEPETAVAWEGTAACGTVRLEPSGWGTRVTMTLTEEKRVPAPMAEPEAVDGAVAVADPPPAVDRPADPGAAEEPPAPEPTEGVVDVPTAASAPRGLFARLMTRFRGGATEIAADQATVEPGSEPQESVAPEPDGSVASEPEPETPVVELEPEPGPEPPAAEAVEPVAKAAPEGEAALAAALDSLGRAHHRPYSRA